mmetsp:Transcript_31861/g.101501  ORF Transcript_31861/g.101501 Transcript_31861/m.101501 type:complete len:435 (+) Transcript_31861:3-1307(+)
MSHPEADVPHALPPARALIYANHAGTSWPKPPGVAEAMLDALEASPVDTGDIYADAHSTIATFFGLPSPSRLVLTTSCTGALQVAINDLKFAAGDIVITSGFEHHALSRAVSRLAWDRGIEHVVCPPDEISDEGTGGGPLDLDFLEKALEAGEGKVRLVAITGASNVTGEVMPIERVVELAHAKGALVLLDAAQVAGLIPLHVAELGVDIFVLAGHKAALGPLGIGAFWAAPHVTFVCPAATCEMASKVGSGGIGPSTFPSFCDVGSVNLPAAAGLAASLRWLESQGHAATGGHACALAARLRFALLSRPGVTLLGSGRGPHTATVGFLVEGLPLREAERFFLSRGIVVRAGSHCAPMALDTLGQPYGTIRASFGATNTGEDVDAIVAAVDAVARACQRAADARSEQKEQVEAAATPWPAHRVCGGAAEQCVIQ